MSETMEYTYSQEILDEISGSSSFHYDLESEKDNKDYISIFEEADINKSRLDSQMKQVFRHKEELKFAYHIMSVSINIDNVLYLQTMIYYFKDEISMRRFIMSEDPDTYYSMNLEDISVNNFIHLNQ